MIHVTGFFGAHAKIRPAADPLWRYAKIRTNLLFRRRQKSPKLLTFINLRTIVPVKSRIWRYSSNEVTVLCRTKKTSKARARGRELPGYLNLKALWE